MLALAAMAVGGVVLALVDLFRTGGIAVELVGAGAAIAAVGLLTLAARDAKGLSPLTCRPWRPAEAGHRATA